MTERPDIVGFLRARIDEDEVTAHWAVELEERYSPPSEGFVTRYEWAKHIDLPRTGGAGSTFMPGAPDPARVLREVEAKRRIVELHKIAGPDRWNPQYCVICGPTMGLAACKTVLAVSISFADHPDYDPAWRPS